MPNIGALLATVNTTYRNTYTSQQKVEWMDITQKQIFQKVKHDALPFFWLTEDSEQYYTLPSNCDRQGITKVTIETAPNSDKYRELGFISIQNPDFVPSLRPFYSLLTDSIFINPAPTAETENRKIYLYYTKRPADLVYTTLDQIPDLNEDFQELLILGCLSRIARARGETEDMNNFSADYNVLMRDYERQYMRSQPGYSKVNDTMKQRSRGTVYTKNGRRGCNYDLIPEDLLGG